MDTKQLEQKIEEQQKTIQRLQAALLLFERRLKALSKRQVVGDERARHLNNTVNNITEKLNRH